MSVGPMGLLGSIAGTPLSQVKGSEADRAQEVTNRARQTQAEKKAENSAGLGEAEEEKGVNDRDADGRRLWERTNRNGEVSGTPSNGDTPPPQSRDATGDAGHHLDLSG